MPQTAHPTRRPRPTFAVIALTVASLLAASLTPSARATPATAEQVNAALERAKAYLYKVQKPDGTWEDQPAPEKVDFKDASDRQSVKAGQWGGPTALAVYALIAAGEKAQEPRLAKAIEFLKKTESVGVYACGLRCQVWLLLPQTPDVQKAMKRDATVLLKSVKSEGSAKGMYDYVKVAEGGPYSHSRAQYGVLGLWAAEQSGAFEVPTGYWRLVEEAWIRHQDPSGGWTYTKPGEPPNHPLTPGMTAVGVATLFITQDYVHAADAVACKGNITNLPIEKGIKWMGDNMDKVATNQNYERDFPYPTLYAVERIGLAGGLKYLGGVDWYQKGAAWLLSKESKNGGWSGGGTPQIAALGDTCFAMLFLARGRNPVVFNKLDYSKPLPANAGPQAAALAAPWNQRPRDLANLTRWIGKTFEADLNWQVVSLQAPAAELLDAPILFVSGNKPLTFDDAEKQKLRDFVQMGGVILGHADCGTPAFATSFAKLGSELFPAYEFRQLEDAHPIYNNPFPRNKWKVKPAIHGLSNGVRELMLLIPAGDPARLWQTRTYSPREEMWQMAANIFIYQSEGKSLRYRGDSHWVAANSAVKPNHTAKVYRVEHAANWDPEPGAWRRMTGVLNNDYKTTLTVEQVKLGDGKLPSAGPALAHMTGTAKFTLPQAQRDELKKFVEGGGTLLADAAGGAGPFADSIEGELAAIFPGTSLQVLPPDHALYAPGGKAIDAFAYRRFAQRVVGQAKSPRLRALMLNNRVAAIISREDLTVGMVGQPVDGVLGYAPQTATDLAAAAVLHVFPPPQPTTKPTTGPATKGTGKTGTTAKPATRKSSKSPAAGAN